MRRRRALAIFFTVFGVSGEVHAQISQRARQIEDRRNCEHNSPACRPEIRAQLIVERQRLRIGLGLLTLGFLAAGAVLLRRHKRIKAKLAKDVAHLNDRLADHSGDSNKNQAN